MPLKAFFRFSDLLKLPIEEYVRMSSWNSQLCWKHAFSRTKMIHPKWKFGRTTFKMAIAVVPFLKVAHCSINPTEMAQVLTTLYPDLGPSPKEKDIIRLADMFYEHHKIKELFELLSAFEDSTNADIVWRLARVHYELANAASNDIEKKQHMYQSFQAATKALALNEKNFACHKWYAIVLDEIGKYEGVKYRLQKSPEVRAHFEKSLEINPDDPTSHHCLGYWHYSFADLPWYQRQAAAAFFATPPSSTYEEAIKCFEHAEKVQPNFYSMNLLMLGKSYAKIGNYKKAVMYLNKLKDYNDQTPEDRKAKVEGAKLLEHSLKKV